MDGWMTARLSLQAMFSACELGVFDLLLGSQKPLTARHVAQELNTNLCSTERLLDTLVAMEILEAETTKGTGEGEEPLETGQTERCDEMSLPPPI